MTAPVEVTQADRDAASDYLSYNNTDWGYCADIRDGRIQHPLASAFARHRIAALEEAARVAEVLGLFCEANNGEVHDVAMSGKDPFCPKCGLMLRRHAYTLAHVTGAQFNTAIRSLKGWGK